MQSESIRTKILSVKYPSDPGIITQIVRREIRDNTNASLYSDLAGAIVQL